MTAEKRLQMLKMDLQISTPAFDEYLDKLLNTAEKMIEREGIKLDKTVEDEELRIMYAAYLYRKRGSENTAMPRYLRWALNNRLFSQKGAVGDVT